MRIFLSSLAVAMSVSAVKAGFRPPAVPLVQNDPFFSVWSAADRLTDVETTHWSGAKQPISIILSFDGKTRRLCGAEPASVSALPQVDLRVRPTQTVYSFSEGGVKAQLKFSTDKTAADLDRFTRPLTYVTLCVEGAKEWDAVLTVSSAMATNDDSAEMTTNRCRIAGLEAVRVGRKKQRPFSLVEDFMRCDWGYAWTVGPKREESSCHWILAYDDFAGLRFLGRDCPAWWRRNGQSFESMLAAAEADYHDVCGKLDAFDRKWESDCERAGGRKYADIASLAYRQSLSACNIVAGENGEMLMFSKENGSNGCMGTVDLIYPQLPHLLLLGPELVKATLNPIMIYATSGKWPYPYAPHDVGRYPIGDGQYYGMKEGSAVGGKSDDASRMPVEESGNMLIALAALSRLEGNADYVSRWWPTVTQWAEFLEKTGFDPGDQLCTDDFAGHLAHNINLSAKSIVALGCYAEMAKFRGESDVASRYRRMAETMAGQWLERAQGGREGATKIAFTERSGQGNDTWSLKYNLVWDRVLGLSLFPPSVGANECAVYQRLALPYGTPLDCRRTYTKADWLVWSAMLSGNRADFVSLIAPLHRFLDETPDRIPFTDWYWADNGRHRYFIARSVVGAVFLPLVEDRRLIKTSQLNTVADNISHPRLFADRKDFEALKIKLVTTELGRLGRNRLLAEAEAQLSFESLESKRDVSGRRMLAVSRSALNVIGKCAMAYRLTGRDAFAKRAIREAMEAAALPDWNPSHFLDTAEMALAVALCYDWLYDVLTAEERECLGTALHDKALAVDVDRKSYGWWMTVPHNWNQVCHGGLAAAAVATAERNAELSERIIRRAERCLPAAMAVFAPGGAFPEGPGYWSYALDYNAIALAAIEKYRGEPSSLCALPGFREQAFFMDSCTGPTGILFNFSDGSALPDPIRRGTFASWWIAERFNLPETLSCNERALFEEYCASPVPQSRNKFSQNGRFFPLTLLFLQDVPSRDKARLPLCRVIDGENPIAMMRTSWTDPEAWFVGVKGGSPSHNHGHMDIGSFVFDALGVRWGYELGNEPYAKVEKAGVDLWYMGQRSTRWSLFRYAPEGHSTLQVGNERQVVAKKSSITRWTDAFPATVALDMSYLYVGMGMAKRTFTLGRNGGLTIADMMEIEGGKSVTWRMNTKASVRLLGNQAVLSQKDAKGRVRELRVAAKPADVKWEFTSIAEPRGRADSANPDMGQLFFTFRPKRSGSQTLRVDFTENENGNWTDDSRGDMNERKENR